MQSGVRVMAIVRIDKDRCISSGMCVGDTPDAFTFDDDELAETTPVAATTDLARLLAIARNCPGQAIIVERGDGGEPPGS